MSAIVIPTGFGGLSIGGVSMITPAWGVLDLEPLWQSPNRRGENVIIPNVPGRRAYAKLVDETSYSLEFLVTGEVNISGVPYTNPLIGLQRNLEYLWENVETGDVAAPAVRSAELEMPDGSFREADVQVQINHILHGTADLVAVLELNIPSGWFVEAAS